MIHLEEVTPDNWRSGLRVREDQRDYVADSAGILARSWAYRKSRSQAFIIYNEDTPVGMGLYYDDAMHGFPTVFIPPVSLFLVFYQPFTISNLSSSQYLLPLV